MAKIAICIFALGVAGKQQGDRRTEKGGGGELLCMPIHMQRCICNSRYIEQSLFEQDRLHVINLTISTQVHEQTNRFVCIRKKNFILNKMYCRIAIECIKRALTSISCVDSGTMFSLVHRSFSNHAQVLPVRPMPNIFACGNASQARQPVMYDEKKKAIVTNLYIKKFSGKATRPIDQIV